MGPKLTMFILFVFFLGNFMSLMVEGDWFGSSDVDLANDLTGYSIVELSGAGFWTIPKMGLGFVTNGLPKVLLWDYSFFVGDWALFRLFLIFVISAPIIWAIAQVFISAIQGVFQRFF